MPLDSREAAEAALEGAAIEDSQDEQPYQQQAPQGTQAPTEPESFYDGNPAELPPDLQPIYKQMQAAFTRKTQEIAPYRHVAEQFGASPEEVAQAMTFLNEFATNPQRQLEVYNSLQQHLTEQGLTPAQASQAASEIMQESDDDEDWEDEDFEDPRVAQLEQKLSNVELYVTRQLQQEQVRNVENFIDSQTAQIRSANPNYTDDDMEQIYALGLSYQGDLHKAREHYEGLRQRVIASYVDQKQQVPRGGAPVGVNTPHAEQPEHFESVTDPRLRAQAEAMLRAAWSDN